MTTPLAIIDLREIVPRNHRERVLRLFDGLRPGARIEMLSEREPQDVLATLEAERSGQFTTEVIEQGPMLWRVRVAKLDATC